MGADLERRGDATGAPPTARSQGPEVPARLRIGGFAFRILFMGVLLVVTARVSIPQNEHVWSVYETPGDLIRLALGLAVCLVILVHLFRRPEDPEAYRTWFYFGVVAVPFALIFAIGIW